MAPQVFYAQVTEGAIAGFKQDEAVFADSDGELEAVVAKEALVLDVLPSKEYPESKPGLIVQYQRESGPGASHVIFDLPVLEALAQQLQRKLSTPAELRGCLVMAYFYGREVVGLSRLPLSERTPVFDPPTSYLSQ